MAHYQDGTDAPYMRRVVPSCHRQVPVLSLVGKGPKGDPGDATLVTPTFADPAEWDIDREYDAYTIVLHEGNSYTSKKEVPSGTRITNDEYWVLTGNYNAQVEEYEQEVQELAGRVDTSEGQIASVEEQIAFLKDIEGYAHAKYEVFTDSSAYAGDGTADVWSYFEDIFNEPSMDMNVNVASGSTGWLNTNASGDNARAYITAIAESQTEEYRNSVQYVILNFGFYDIVNNPSGNYETEGRTVVNYVSNYYPNAMLVVNPVSNNYCYGYNRTVQMNMYLLNYGMIRSQVPIKIVPWYVAYNVNQLAINHYYDSDSENPSVLNSGGTNSVGAMIKSALIGCENAYERSTRTNLDNYLDADYFVAYNTELSFDVETMHVSLSSGKITAQQAISAAETVVGKITAPSFTVIDDIILAACIQNTQNNPLRGFLVLGANDNIYFRLNGDTGVNSGAILRLLPTAAYEPAFRKVTV